MSSFAHDKIVPNKASDLSKKEQVADMFNDIAPKYDFLNRFLSAGIDVRWRKKAIAELAVLQPKTILDVATGTADVALMTQAILQPRQIIGIDISEGMLAFGREKIKQAQLTEIIQLYTGDSETINFDTHTFDAVTVAFGVRNFQHLEKGLKEMLRVVKPGGKVVILEFSKPTAPVFKQFYQLYMNYVTPTLGKLFSKNKTAYQYLNDSVQAFPEGAAFVQLLNDCGYINTYAKPLTFGICTIYCGSKPA